LSYLLKRVLIFIIGLAVIIITLLYFLQPNPIEPKNNETTKVEIDETLISQINLGKSLYVTHCASCHGDNLQGQPNWSTKKDEDGHNLSPPLNGTGHTWHHSQEQLFSVIKYGFKIYNENYDGKMQGNDKLNDNDIWSILAYMKSVWPESIQEKYDSISKH
jgi:mono/diheme cytochrome c family protein|tara:strand:- start:176 stop:658 length:483 start_codon:yes stop_codon:yes gene_type:complete